MNDIEIANVFWGSLKRDPEHKDRRQTEWGTKTKEGLAAVIKRLAYEADDNDRRPARP